VRSDTFPQLYTSSSPQPKRIYVHEAVYDQFVAKFVDITKVCYTASPSTALISSPSRTTG
jgi:acyl-CoA reductase-like NAD-dependent aldehyde dehydrogenase